MVSTMATSDQINDINQQLLNSMSAGRSQPQSGSCAYWTEFSYLTSLFAFDRDCLFGFKLTLFGIDLQAKCASVRCAI